MAVNLGKKTLNKIHEMLPRCELDSKRRILTDVAQMVRRRFHRSLDPLQLSGWHTLEQVADEETMRMKHSFVQ